MADIKTLKDMSITELKDELIKKEKELVSSKFKLTARQLTDSSSVKKIKKDIARIKTVFNTKK